MLHSLYSRGDEGHADHHQVQNIEIVSTEWTFMEEGSIGCHLSGVKVHMLESNKEESQLSKIEGSDTNCLTFNTVLNSICNFKLFEN